MFPPVILDSLFTYALAAVVIFMDSTFADFVMQDRINNARDQVNKAIDRVESVLSRLKAK